MFNDSSTSEDCLGDTFRKSNWCRAQ